MGLHGAGDGAVLFSVISGLGVTWPGAARIVFKAQIRL
jgi:hypothetical protein